MEVERLVLVFVFTLIVVALIWARIYFFKVNSQASRKVSYINDPAVLIQMLGFYYYVINLEEFFLDWRVVVFIYLSGLVLFIWALASAKQLDFANSGRDGELITRGPYAIVRHPCYLAYILFWLGNSLLIFVPVMWASSFILVWIYVYSARKEEVYLLQSPLGTDYLEYKSRVGMFLPKLP